MAAGRDGYGAEIAPPLSGADAVIVTMHPPEADVLTRAQAAARLGVTRTTMARWAQQGRGPAYSLTGERKGRALYSAASIAEWLERRRRTTSR
jgi:excisionase family DNA binding protein